MNASYKSLARSISLVENESQGYWEVLKNLEAAVCPVIGITGPPGAGKSTLLDAMLASLLAAGKKVGVLAVDPSSALSHGSLLGDRIRMSAHFLNPAVYIRSLSSRSALGGLSAKAREITDVMCSAGFDFVFIETVGVGQSEIEVASVADQVVVVLVPEAGDEIQTLKSGLLEIADLFVVNKCDRPGADALIRDLSELGRSRLPPVSAIKTQANNSTGVEELIARIDQFPQLYPAERLFDKLRLKIFSLIQHERMKNVNYLKIEQALKEAWLDREFNPYRFAENVMQGRFEPHA